MISLISIILKYKKAVVITTLAGAVLSAIISLVIPPRFEVQAAFLPFSVEKEITGGSNFFSQLGSFGETYASFLRVRRNFIIDYIIRSRRMSMIMNKQFDLENVYDVGGFEEAREKLLERTSVELREEGVIVIAVDDRNPHRAKAMVEGYLHYLDSLLIDLKIENAGERQRFLEVELARRVRSIAAVDSAMTDFMVEHGVIEIENQARAAIDVAAKLRARLSVMDIERQLLAMTLKPGSHELEMITMEVDKLRDELTRFREGSGEDPQVFPPLARFPDLASEYTRLFTERSLHEFARIYVQLKLEEARVAVGRRESVIRVIDPPALPERRAWPKRKQIVMISTMAVFFWTCFLLLVRERWREGYFAPDRLEGPVPAVSRTVEKDSRDRA
ncbi:MAG: hypothetical protein JSV33_16125 [bacterium]|nr:MAG: hypothetical protein JSV33_16125 [bacterium]